jgi:S1 RNA binding domain protein
MTLEVGSIVEGVVTGITHFGAFVELPGGKTGLVHISEVADSFVRDIKEFVKEQDHVKVKILSMDERGKVGLSIKQAQEGYRPAPPRGRRFERRMDQTFEDKLNRFMKDSEERLATIKRSTEAKRGGRGSSRG